MAHELRIAVPFDACGDVGTTPHWGDSYEGRRKALGSVDALTRLARIVSGRHDLEWR
jgi:hypothetical protein